MVRDKSQIIVRRILLGVFVVGLLILSYRVLEPFLIPVAWAGILAYVTWPIYRRLRAVVPSPGGSALLMTLVLTAAFILPVIWLIIVLRDELAIAYDLVSEQLSHGPITLPEFVTNIPWLGEQLQAFLDRITLDRGALRAEVADWLERGREHVGQLAGSVTRNVAKFGFALLTVFFFYRDGQRLISQLRLVLEHFLGSRAHRYLDATGITTKAVVYGIVLTAIVQGMLAGLGYWVAGVQAPVLLGAVTALVALIPFGTPFVWGSIAIALLIMGNTWGGIGLLLWGTFAVSWVDNLIRPLVISTATKIPFLLVMFGVLGGAVAFGMVGLFVGPIILAVLLAVWQEWLEEHAMREPGEGSRHA